MTQEEIVQYNKLCAEFLGYVNLTPDDKDFDFYEKLDGVLGKMLEPKSMKFHSDWNWIMVVVDAIEKLKFNVRITIACIIIENAFDNDSNLSPIYKFHSMQGEFESKKEAVVQAINQFLIWYNEQRT